MDASRACSISLIALVLASTAVSLYHLNGDSFDIADREPLLVVTDSMDGAPQPYPIPSIPRGSLVVIHRTGPSGLEVGDVAAFRTAVTEGLVVHRVIGLYDDHITTKGDRLPLGEHVLYSDVVGKVAGVSHPLGVIVSLFRSPAPVFLVLAAVLFGFYGKIKEREV